MTDAPLWRVTAAVCLACLAVGLAARLRPGEPVGRWLTSENVFPVVCIAVVAAFVIGLVAAIDAYIGPTPGEG